MIQAAARVRFACCHSCLELLWYAGLPAEFQWGTSTVTVVHSLVLCIVCTWSARPIYEAWYGAIERVLQHCRPSRNRLCLADLLWQIIAQSTCRQCDTISYTAVMLVSEILVSAGALFLVLLSYWAAVQ